jgi:uncharacterized membrane protein YeaQ/YmgE (transglycosylase-associated protein family)
MQLLIALIVVIVVIALGVSVIGLAFSLLWSLLIGLVIGLIARLLVPNTRGLGGFATALYGIAGSIVGGMIAHAADAGDLGRFALSVLVAAVLIALTSARRAD